MFVANVNINVSLKPLIRAATWENDSFLKGRVKTNTNNVEASN